MTISYRQRILGRRAYDKRTAYAKVIAFGMLRGEAVAYIEWEDPRPLDPRTQPSDASWRDTVRVLDIVAASVAA